MIIDGSARPLPSPFLFFSLSVYLCTIFAHSKQNLDTFFCYFAIRIVVMVTCRSHRLEHVRRISSLFVSYTSTLSAVTND